MREGSGLFSLLFLPDGNLLVTREARIKWQNNFDFSREEIEGIKLTTFMSKQSKVIIKQVQKSLMGLWSPFPIVVQAERFTLPSRWVTKVPVGYMNSNFLLAKGPPDGKPNPRDVLQGADTSSNAPNWSHSNLCTKTIILEPFVFVNESHCACWRASWCSNVQEHNIHQFFCGLH